MLALPHGAADTGAIGSRAADTPQRMTGQIRRQMLGHGDRSHPGSTAAVRNRERLVQIDVTHVRPDQRGTGQADLRIHVGAIHVHLPAVLVDDGADVANGVFEAHHASTDR